MQYRTTYRSPAGEILMTADDMGLTGLWFKGGKFYGDMPERMHEDRETPVFAETRRWLDIYFGGREPDFMPLVHMSGTPFQMEVWKLLCRIPYGATMTYGEIAKEIAAGRGIRRMSAQAVGGAVGHNAISIIIPCHRVIGADGSLTGYGGGMDKKIRLLNCEGVSVTKFIERSRVL